MVGLDVRQKNKLRLNRNRKLKSRSNRQFAERMYLSIKAVFGKGRVNT